MTRDRVLSGMRPAGSLPLGNYLGALANWVRMHRIVDVIPEGSRRARVEAQRTMNEMRAKVRLAP
jgi:hypothetical protein